MKRLIMLIDDNNAKESNKKVNELSLMKSTIDDEIKARGMEMKLEVKSNQIPTADVLSPEDLDVLMENIRKNILEYEKVLIVVDLNLVGNTYNSLAELKNYLMTGILLKRYIFFNLSDEEKQKAKFVFISAYLDKTSDLKQALDSIIKKEEAVGVSKPKIKWSSPEYEKDVKQQYDVKKQCDKKHKFFKAIQSYYDTGTIFGDFIGTILESILS